MDQGKPIDARALYHVRMIVLVEVGPQANEYRQVVMDRAHFARVSQAVVQPFPRVGGAVDVPTDLTGPLVKLPEMKEHFRKT
jgi:hypothetical protein